MQKIKIDQDIRPLSEVRKGMATFIKQVHDTCIPAVPELNRLIGESLLQKDSALNGKEIRFLRKNVGLKAVELQNYIGVDNATISRWERGIQKISLSNDRLLRVVYAHIKGLPNDKITSMVKDRFAQIKRNEVTTPLYQIDLNVFSNNWLLTA
jgi:DNA-binding transcriptional regulator YiaG